MSSKEKLLALVAENGSVDFGGNYQITSIWDGTEDVPYYALRMDEEGIFACPEGDEDNLDCYDPITPDEYGEYLQEEEDWSDLLDDVVE